MRTNGRMLTVPRVPMPPNTGMNPPALRGSLVATLLGIAEVRSSHSNSNRNKINRSRAASYGVCIMAVVCGAVLLGLMAGAGVEPGDENEATGEVATTYTPPWPLGKRDRLIENTFIVALLPALFGVRCALGPKTKKN
jgi:hypothetical protein